MFSRFMTLAAAACLLFLAAPAAFAQDEAGPAEIDEAPAAHIIDIAAVDYAIEAPDALLSGWNTLRFANDGNETHFAFLIRMPEGKTFADYEAEVYPVFLEIVDALNAGEIDQGGAIGMLMQNAPEWFFATQMMGGPGFLAPGHRSEVTLDLPPGDYALECYMKTAEGDFHVMEGMARPLVVADEASPGAPPEASLHITLSNEGIAIEGDLAPGEHVVAVHFAEQPEMGPGHDVNVARLSDDAAVEDIVRWMSWLNPGGLTPPEPAEFVGGIRPMPAGHTAYFTMTLEPGRYLFVSENTGYQGVVKEVTVDGHRH